MKTPGFYTLRLSLFVVIGISTLFSRNELCAQRLLEFASQDDNAVLFVPRASKLIEGVFETSFARDARWSSFWQFACHVEYGLLKDSAQKRLEEAKKIIIDELRIGEAVVCMPDLGEKHWFAVCEFDCQDVEAVLERLSATVSDLLVDENGADALTADEETNNNDSPGIKKQKQTERNSSIVIGSLEVHYVISERRIALSPDRDLVTSRSLPVDSKSSIKGNRAHLALDKALAARPADANSLKLFLNQKATQRLLGLDDNAARNWGANEVPAVGFAIHLCSAIDNKDVKGKEIVVDGFALVTKPRVGIFESIVTRGFPETLPVASDDLALYWFVNMDWRRFRLGQRRISRLGEQTREASPQDQYAESWAKLVGGLEGQYWLLSQEGIEGRVDFTEAIRGEDALDMVVQSTLPKEGQATPPLVYKRSDLLGFPAATGTIYDQKICFVFSNGFLYSGAEAPIVNIFTEGKGQNGMPSGVREMVDELEQLVSFDSDPSALVAVFPKGATIFQRDIVMNLVKPTVQQILKDDFRKGESVFIENYKKLMSAMMNFDFPEPKSKRECANYALLTGVRILSDNFSKWIFLGADSDSGVRFAGKSFAVPKQ